MTARARYPLDAPSKCATQGCDGDPGWNRFCARCHEEWVALAWPEERTQAARHQVYLNTVAVQAQLRGGRRRRMRERALVVLAVLWLIYIYGAWRLWP